MPPSGLVHFSSQASVPFAKETTVASRLMVEDVKTFGLIVRVFATSKGFRSIPYFLTMSER